MLTLMSMHLAQNSSVMDRARKEIKNSLSEGPISLEQLGQLTYLDQVTREVRRHSRIFASTFFDWVTEPFEYAGYHVPKGWKATGGIYTTMQDDTVFTHPNAFDPDRFAPERVEDERKENSNADAIITSKGVNHANSNVQQVLQVDRRAGRF